MDYFLNNEFFLMLQIAIGSFVAIVFTPILLSKSIVKVTSGIKNKNEKMIKIGIYYLISSIFLIYLLIRVFLL